MKQKLEQLQHRIGYHFHNIELLKTALTHSSYTNEKELTKTECNERLEFLGDAVLQLLSSEFLYARDPKMLEGKLTKWRASLVCESALAHCAKQINLSECLILGWGEEHNGGRQKDSMLADAMEAVLGAIYLDGGFANAKEYAMKFILNDVEHKKLFFDSKTILQEHVQANHMPELAYRLIGEEGPDHNKTFVMAAYIGDVVYGTGSGKSKKAAEQQASYEAILKIRRKNKE